METVNLIDYAHPAMMAENALKEMHWAMLEQDYDKALEQALVALTEVRMTINAIRHEKESRGR